MLLMVMSLASTAFAVSPSITFHGFSRGFDFQPGSEYTETDLFGKKGGYIPTLSKDTVGKPCPVCGEDIRKENFLGGSIYYCFECQK